MYIYICIYIYVYIYIYTYVDGGRAHSMSQPYMPEECGLDVPTVYMVETTCTRVKVVRRVHSMYR